MHVEQGGTWLESRGDALPTPAMIEAERELALIDRVIGLETQVDELRRLDRLDPASALVQRESVAALKQTLTWRAGRIVTLPIRVARVAKRVVLR